MASSSVAALATQRGAPVASRRSNLHYSTRQKQIHAAASHEIATFYRPYSFRNVHQISSARHSSIALPRAQGGGPSSSASSPEEDKEQQEEQVASTTTANNNDVEKLSTEEIQRQMGEIRRAEQEREEAAQSSDSLVSGVLEEVALIQWPSFTSAFLNTLLVIGLVFGTSVVLFGVNTALTEISNTIYSH